MIMNRDKVLELAREAELVRQLALEVPFVVDRLERFAALIEREVRGGMSRDNVFELMLTAGCSKYCDPKHPELEGFIVNDSVLDRIVALIEREVRGDAEPVTVLPDGSAFAVMSFPLPKDHWLYAERQYRNGEYEPIELGEPILTHEMRDAVVSAVRYAVRSATNCGKEVDFDPDALVQNAVYALCGSYGTLKPKQEQSPTPAVDAESVASVHIKDGCLIGSQRKSGVDIPDGQYALYPIGTSPAPAVDAKPVARLRFYKGEVVVTKDYETVERNGEFDVYTHPAPAVVRQLVNAIEPLAHLDLKAGQLEKYDDDLTVYQRDNTKITIGDIRRAQAALAAAKEARL